MATKKKKSQNIYVGLDDSARDRLSQAAKQENRSTTEVAREAILWYLDNRENLKNEARESEVAKAIKYATDQHIKATRNGVERICKMLARQGTAIGTLYELSWRS